MQPWRRRSTKFTWHQSPEAPKQPAVEQDGGEMRKKFTLVMGVVLMFAAAQSAEAASASKVQQATSADTIAGDRAAIGRMAEFEESLLAEVNVGVAELQALPQLLNDATAIANPAQSRAFVESRVNQGVARVDQALARMRAMPMPDLGTLSVPATYQPAETLRINVEIMTQIRASLLTVPDMVDSLRSNDPARSQRAIGQMFQSFRLIFAAQLRGLRAQMAADVPESADFYQSSLLFNFVTSGDRLLESLQIQLGGRPDSALPSDMRRLADAIDSDVAALGSAVQRRKTELLAAAQSEGRDVRRLRAAVEQLDVLSVNLGSEFRTFARALRQLATTAARDPNSLAAVQGVITPLRTLRAGIDENIAQQYRILGQLRD
jgi:hypothetical protein